MGAEAGTAIAAGAVARRRRAAYRLAGALAAGLLVAGWSVLPGYGVDPATDPALSGCPSLPPRDAGPEAHRLDEVVPASTAPTAVDRAARDAFDLPGALHDVRHVNRHFVPVFTGELPTTGLRVEVRSDGLLAVDAEALDALAAAPLLAADRYRDPWVEALFTCYARRVLDDGELRGTTVRLVVPSDPYRCFRAGRLVDAGAGCDARGVTVPAVDASLSLFGLSLGGVAGLATIVATPGRGADAEREVAAIVLHELVHLYDNELGMPPWSGELQHYEQRAYYVQRQLERLDERRLWELPLPIRYAGL